MKSLAVQEQLFALRTLYLSQLAGKIEQLKVQWKVICQDADLREINPEFQRLVHNLRGTAGTYGYQEVGEIAGEVENILTLSGTIKTPDWAGIDKNVADLLHSLAVVAKTAQVRGHEKQHSPAKQNTTVSPKTLQKPLLYIVDDDADFCALLSEQLNAQYHCLSCHSKTDFTKKITEQLPDAVIMDMSLPEGRLAGADAALELLRKNQIPLVFTSVRGDQEARLAAIRAGADGYFLKQDDPAEMFALLEQLITHRPAHPYRVLMIDDDAELCSLLQLKFRSAGIETKVIYSGDSALAEIETFMPELILLDVSMPEINGLELGALIRQYKFYNHIPIIYLTAFSGEKIHLATMRVGGDDYLHKPLEADYLTQFVLARLVRGRVTRQGEHSLQISLNELKHLQQGVNQHAIVSMADLAGRITYANEKFSEVSGYTREELMGKNHRIVKSGLHTAEFYREMWGTISEGEIWSGIIVNRRKDGRQYSVYSTIVPLLDDYGLPKSYLSVRTDLTPIEKLNDELFLEKSRLALALEASNAGIWEWNLSENKAHYDNNWNHLLGYPEASQQSWPLLIHPDDFDEAFMNMHALLDNKTGLYLSEHRKLNASGGWDWVHESGKAIVRDKDGCPARIMGTMRVINTRKLAETHALQMRDQLNQAMKMEAVGHLTAGIAHDFNNILGAMMGYVDLSKMLLRGDAEIPLEKLFSYLDTVSASGNRAKQLIAQMLTFSRISPEGGDTSEIPSIRLAPVVKEVVSLLRSSIPSSIKLNYQLESDELSARIQAVQLHQIILNLCINSRDAINKFGSINIAIGKYAGANQACTSCKNSFEGEYVSVTVKDSGSGIPEHVVDKIFDPFFTTKEVGKGTGMGLSVVHGLVHSLGGHILVESNAEMGSAISILLPQQTVAAPDSQPVDNAAMPKKIKGATIMVVDDEKSITTMLHELLTRYEVNVVCFNEPALALADFDVHHENIDLVITDETMPGMSGMNMASQMLSIKPSLPIILCTGYSEHATPALAEERGIAGFFYKPLNINELVNKIELLLEA